MTKLIFLITSLAFSLNLYATVDVHIDGVNYKCNRSSEAVQGRYRCVLNCVNRYNNGGCSNYGPDFCGYEASCSANCQSRYNNGACSSYAADICRSSEK